MNKAIINKLSKESFRANKLRNFFTVLAIILTTILFTSVLTIGLSLVESMQQATFRQVGGYAHGSFKYLTPEQSEILQSHPSLVESGVTVTTGILNNEVFSSKPVEVSYMDETAAKLRFANITTGSYPVKPNEVATQTWVLDYLGVPHEIGASIPLEFSIGNEKFQETFYVSGFWEEDHSVLSVGTALIAPSFLETYLTSIDLETLQKDDPSLGSLTLDVMFKNAINIDQKLQSILEDTGLIGIRTGTNWAYQSGDISDPSNLITYGSIILLIIFSGYLLIYNIFYISVVRDTKFYGLLKTLGTSPKQIKNIMRKQSFLLALLGIPIGLLIGYLIGIYIVPFTLSGTSAASSIALSINPLIFIGSACFTLFTIHISSYKPCKIASKISPIEAVKYNEVHYLKTSKIKNSKGKAHLHQMALANLIRNKRKSIVVLASLSLSIILFNSIYSLISGFDANKYIERFITSDFLIADGSYHTHYTHFEETSSVPQNIYDRFQNIENLTSSSKIYFTTFDLSLDDHLTDLLNTMVSNSEYMSNSIQSTLTNGNIPIQLYGLESPSLENFSGSSVIEGFIDIEKFMSGDYILISDPLYNAYYTVGDQVTLTLPNGKSKSFEVMALVDEVYNVKYYSPTGYLAYIPSTAFEELVDTPQIMSVELNTTSENLIHVQNEVDSILAPYPNLEYRDRQYYLNEFEDFITMFSGVGYALSFIIALIGVINFINTFLTSILARKHEFAIFEAVGMTKKQLRLMLIYEGLWYGILTTLIILIFGTPISYLAVTSFGKGMWYFSYHFNILPTLLLGSITLIFSILIPLACYYGVEQDSIIERLRQN